MKLMVLLLSGLFSTAGFSQIYFGTSHEYTKAKIFKKINDNYHNNIIIKDPEIGYQQCQQDHSTIIKLVQKTEEAQIVRIIEVINSLSKTKEFEGITKNILKAELLNRIINHMILNEMNKELLSKNIKDVVYDSYSKNRKGLKVFEMKYRGIDLESYLTKTIKLAQKY